jgi:hypothetical protein
MFCHGLRSIVFETIDSKQLPPTITGNFTIEWGDGQVAFYSAGYYTSTNGTNPRHTYSNLDYPNGFNGVITIRSTTLASIDSLIGFTVTPNSDPTQNYYPLVIKGNQLKKLTGLNNFKLTNENVLFDGNLDEIPRDLTNFSVYRTKLAGRLGQLPRTFLETFDVNYVSGTPNRTIISGSTADFPRLLKSFKLYSDNIIKGPVNLLPPNINTFILWGQNSLSGKTSDLPLSINNVHIAGSNTTINGYTSGRQWANPMYQMQIASQVPTLKVENDYTLIELANVTNWGGLKSIYLTGQRSTLSNNAVLNVLNNTYGVFVTPSTAT